MIDATAAGTLRSGHRGEGAPGRRDGLVDVVVVERDADPVVGQDVRRQQDAGVLLPPYPLTDNRICVAFDEDDVDQTVEAARRAFAAVA